MGLNGFIFKKINENENIKMKKNPGSRLGVAPINGSQDFHSIWDGLAVLFSR